MSGEKRSPIQIVRDDLNRHRREVTDLNSQLRNQQQALEGANRQRNEDNRRFQQQMRHREDVHKQAVSGLKSNMRQMEERHHHAMVEQNNAFNEQIDRSRFEFNQAIAKEKNQRIAEMREQKTQLENRMEVLVGEERAERQQEIQRLEYEMQEMEAELKSDIARVEQEFGREINLVREEQARAINNVYQWTSERLQEQRNEYLQIAEDQQEQLNTLRSDVDAIFAKESMNRETAATFIADLEQQISIIESNLPHERFTPGQLALLKSKVNNAKNMLGSMEQSAFASAQQAYYEMADLRAEILRKEKEFEFWHSATLEAARGVFGAIRANRQVALAEDSGTIEVDYWTGGKFSKLEEEAKGIRDRLAQEKNKLSLEEVKSLLDQVQDIADKQDQCIQEALERAISSEYRAMMGDVVVEALEKEGFAMTDSGYEMQDQRKVYIVRLENRAGTEIMAVIAPDDETHTNTISINTRDEFAYDEKATQERFQKVRAILKAEGLQLGEPECQASHIDEFYDVENILKQGGTGIPKRVLERAKMLNSQTKQQ